METDVVESPVPVPPIVAAEVAEIAAEPVALEPAAEPAAEPADSPSPQKAYWTPERRSALSEKMKQRHREQSAFALTDEHEFPTSPAPAKVMESDTGKVQVAFDSLPIPAVPSAFPGTALSPFRRCSCLGVLPGRVCNFCFGTKWTKLCPKCEGEGRIHLTVRKGAERSQPCGHCGGKGTLPANAKAIAEATKAAEEFAAATIASPSQNGHAVTSTPTSTPASEFRRAVKLPGIGVTSKKRIGTLAARQREGQRNAARKAKRKATRQAIAS